jgi:predicted methyltransferase
MSIATHGLIVCGVIATVSAFSPAVHAQDQRDRLRTHMAAPDRAEADQQRDRIRRPIEVMEFLGAQDGMTALDVIAAGGWYTGILSAAVGPTGHVYSQNPDFIVEREGFVPAETARHAELGNVEPLHGDIAGIDGQIDIAISNQNLHDLAGSDEDAALALIASVYRALKPRGVFGLMDHRGVAGQPNAELHRMEVATARDLLMSAGFEVEAESELLAVSTDDHTKGSGDESLNGVTDRFLLKARKPREM